MAQGPAGQGGSPCVHLPGDPGRKPQSPRPSVITVGGLLPWGLSVAESSPLLDMHEKGEAVPATLDAPELTGRSLKEPGPDRGRASLSKP